MLVFLMMIESPEDRDKFIEIYNLYEKKMYAVAYKILNNREDAEDIVHDTFQALIENLDKIIEIECHKTWNFIVTIIKNKSFNLYHKKKKSSASAMEDYNMLPQLFSKTLENAIEEQELQQVIVKAILTLPDNYRNVLYLHYYNELSFEEIAEVLEMSNSNVRQIAVRARKRLEEVLRKRGVAHG